MDDREEIGIILTVPVDGQQRRNVYNQPASNWEWLADKMSKYMKRTDRDGW